VGTLSNLGHVVSDQTVGNILRGHGIAPAPKRAQQTSWKDFIAAHMAVLAGVDFFTVEVLTWRGLATYYVLFFLHLESRRLCLAGVTRRPTEVWMQQMARNAMDDGPATLRENRYVLHDRDAKFCASFQAFLASGNVNCLALPPRSPNLNAFAERWVRSVKEECLSKLILFGETSLRRALTEFIEKQRPTVPFNRDIAVRGRIAGSPRAPARRAPEVLLPRRMSFLTKRVPQAARATSTANHGDMMLQPPSDCLVARDKTCRFSKRDARARFARGLAYFW
jgi:hypothetical protein